MIDCTHLIEYACRCGGNFSPEIGNIQAFVDHFGQRYIKLLLKIFELYGYSRLCEVQLLSRFGNTLGLGDFQENGQLMQGIVHKNYLC